MITKKISRTLTQWLRPVFFLLMLSLMISCQKKEAPVGQTSAPSKTERAQSGNEKDTLTSIIYVGGRNFTRSFLEEHRNKGVDPPQPYNRAEMIEMTSPYVRRAVRAANHNNPAPNDKEHIDLAKERLVLYLDKATLLALLSDSVKSTGLIAILATQIDTLHPARRPHHQTFILAPFDINTGKVLTSADDGEIQGWQRWPTVSSTDVSLSRMAGGDVDTNIDATFTDLGIH